MGLGQKLQAVSQKVNTKLGTQDGTIVIRKRTVTENAKFGRAYTAGTNSDVSLTAGVKVERVRAFETDAAGTIQVDDLKLTIPGNLVTETQFTDAFIVYAGRNWQIVSRAPVVIYSGVVAEWRVIARVLK